MEFPTNRRTFVRGAMSSVAAATIAIQPSLAAQDATPAAGIMGRVETPRWVMELIDLQDPYTGTLQVPVAPPAGTRVIAVSIAAINESDQPWNFTPIDVPLRDATGTEHRGGGAIGAEPMISPRNLNPGELSRGWVWFLVPVDVAVTEFVYVAPQPQLRIALP